MEPRLSTETTQKLRQKFSRSRKIFPPHEFKKIISSGKKISSRFITLFLLPNEFSKSRFGFSVPKRIGCATQRNRMKRVLRESVRKNKDLSPWAVDGIFIVRKNFVKLKKEDLYQHITDFFKQVIQRKFTVC